MARLYDDCSAPAKWSSRLRLDARADQQLATDGRDQVEGGRSQHTYFPVSAYAQSLKVAELKELLTKAGQPTTGVKQGTGY
jgi:hypothetical protein